MHCQDIPKIVTKGNRKLKSEKGVWIEKFKPMQIDPDSGFATESKMYITLMLFLNFNSEKKKSYNLGLQ